MGIFSLPFMKCDWKWSSIRSLTQTWLVYFSVSPSTKGGKSSKKFCLLENLLISFSLLEGLLTMWDLGVGAWVERRQNIINTTETHWHQTDWSALGKQLMRELWKQALYFVKWSVSEMPIIKIGTNSSAPKWGFCFRPVYAHFILHS